MALEVWEKGSEVREGVRNVDMIVLGQ